LWRDSLENRLRQDWWARGVSISPQATIRLGKYADLEIGAGSMIGPYSLLDLQDNPFRETPSPSVLKIGRRTAINEFNNIRAAGGTVVIGDSCLISQFVSIVVTNHAMAREMCVRDQPWDLSRNEVRIGDDVWIGTHAVILPGVTIGTGSVIGAGAIVTSDIPEYAIAAGVPAKVIKYR
jgi:acetyltransferase-like isoleucine patch superfamily enzyme